MRPGRGRVPRSEQREVVAAAMRPCSRSPVLIEAWHDFDRPIDPWPGVAVGTWSGGRFMHFGEPLDDERFVRADHARTTAIRTVITADVYGAGEADAMLGRAIAGRPRDEMCVVGAVGHDFYRASATAPRASRASPIRALRGPDAYADYLRMATERSLERCGIDRFDLLLLHNPDRIGYTSEAVWNGDGGAARRRADRHDRRRPGPGQRLHARPDRLPRALRRADRLGDDHPQPARAVARASCASTPPRRPTSR